MNWVLEVFVLRGTTFTDTSTAGWGSMASTSSCSTSTSGSTSMPLARACYTIAPSTTVSDLAAVAPAPATAMASTSSSSSSSSSSCCSASGSSSLPLARACYMIAPSTTVSNLAAVAPAPATAVKSRAAAIDGVAIKPSTDAIRDPATVAALQQAVGWDHHPLAGITKRRKPRPMKTHDSQWATAKALAKEIAARAAQARAAQPYPF